MLDAIARSWLATVLVAVTAAACHPRDETPLAYLPDVATAPAERGDGRVVLVTIDGARWQEVFEGSDPTWGPRTPLTPEAIMPRSHALAETRGLAMGANRPGCGEVRTASRANVSLPGYREIFTAHPSRCLDNSCGPVDWTILDEAARAGAAAASIGSWQKLSLAVAGGSNVFVSAGEAGTYRQDAVTASLALAYLRSEEPALLHVGLGDPDEHAHRGDYASYLGSLQAADAFIGDVVDTLENLGLMAQTTVLVTPDHGRNANFRDHGMMGFEASRTFLFAFGDRVAARGIVCPRSDVTLADIAPTIAVLMGLPLDTSPDAGSPIEAIVPRLE